MSATSRRSRFIAALPAVALAGAALALIDPPAALADTTPATGTPATVSADALPTVQQNGVVWSQVTVGNTVYATGKFTQTYPAGAANSAANYTARTNLLAYDITTGKLLPFNHTLNAQGLVVTASPDGSRIYVGGDFTQVDGQTRNRIAAFDTKTGSLITTFKPSMNAEVHAISATNSTVYAGGTFTTVGGVARSHIAAVAAANGALSTTWAPSASNDVATLLVTPSQKEVVAGGEFQTMNGVNVYGLTALTTATGAVVPYAINQYVHDYTPANRTGSSILSLATDGTNVYGSGYSYGQGNFEGTFSVVADTGAVNFINDCHGDTYDVLPVGGVLYSVSHNHSCEWIGSFHNTSPSWTWHRTLAFTTAPTGTDTGPDDYGWNYAGQPASSVLNWFPDLSIGAVTGQKQAAWSVTGNSKYIAEGGEFPSVNGVAQAGLVRFAVSSAAPNKVKPAYSTALTPTITANGPNSATINWGATYDEDNQALTYRLFRDGAGPLYTVTTNSNPWTLPAMSYTDTGVLGGSTHSYTVQVSDSFGNTTISSVGSVTMPTGGAAASTSVSDDFSRTVSGGWGTSSSGALWNGTSKSALSVNNGTGSIAMTAAGASPSAYLNDLSTTSTDTTATLSTDKAAAGGAILVQTVGRRVSATALYEGTVNLTTSNAVTLQLRAVNGATTTTLASTTLSGVTYSPNTQLKVRLQVTGTNPTTLNFKVWPAASAEPASWQLTATDSTAALQTAGSVGIAPYLSSAATNAPVTLNVTSFATTPVA